MVLKYRAMWQGEMYQVRGINYLHKRVDLMDFELPYKYRTVDMKDIFLMQSTGLFDKNGVEIFEGDVLQRSLPSGAIISGTVEFTKGMFLVDGLECISEDYIVIGNLHENPDLAN